MRLASVDLNGVVAFSQSTVASWDACASACLGSSSTSCLMFKVAASGSGDCSLYNSTIDPNDPLVVQWNIASSDLYILNCTSTYSLFICTALPAWTTCTSIIQSTLFEATYFNFSVTVACSTNLQSKRADHLCNADCESQFQCARYRRS